MNRSAWRTALPVWCAAFAGIGLVSTLVMRWVTSGPGSTLVGHDLADALRTVPGRHHGWSDAAGVGLYLVAALGCVALMTCWVRSWVVVVARAVVAAGVPAVLIVLVVRGVVPLANFGAGALVASLAGLVLVATPFVRAITDIEERS